LTRIRTYAALGALTLAVPVIVAGCGGDDTSDVPPQTVIDQTLSNDQSVSSGDLSLTLGGSATGDESGSFDASISGPFQRNADDPAEIPQLDLTGSITAEGAGQSISFDGGVTVTEDNAYLEYGGNAYEVGADNFAQIQELAGEAAAQQTETEGLSFSEAFTQGCEQSLGAQGGDTSACDVDFQGWLGDLSNDGEEEIEGTPTTHISGNLNVDAMVQDLVELGTAVPQAASQVPSEEEIQQATDAISEASFDLYSGVDDSILRGLDFSLSIDTSSIPEAAGSGIEAVDLNFSLRLGGVNEPQTIEAPSDAQPIDELLGQFGLDSSALGDLGALGGSGSPLAPTGGGGGGAGDPNAYLDCIAEASTPEAIDACAAGL
jgi:hypothetical protein